MKKISVNAIIKLALSMTMYIVLSYLSSFLVVFGVSLRLSEFLIFLVLIDPLYIYGICIGTFVTNLISLLGPFDMIFGTFASFLAMLCIIFIKNKYLKILLPSLINALIVGLEYILILKAPFLLTTIVIFTSEFACCILGYLLVKKIKKNNYLYNLIKIIS